MESLGQVNQGSLRGNLHYQGFLQREAERGKRIWTYTALAGVFAFLVCFSLIVLEQGNSTIEAVHTPVSLKLEDIDGRDALRLIAEYGGLSIKGIEDVQGRVKYLELKNQPWDAALAQVAGELGYRVEITGSKVELLSVTTLMNAG